MMKIIIHYIVAIIYIIFGVLNFNDPDFYIWGPIYIATAAIPILYLWNRLSSSILWLWMGITGIYLITYVPDIIHWINEGMPNIAGSMKATEPHIELTREFFGLLLCFIIPLIYYFLLKKKMK